MTDDDNFLDRLRHDAQQLRYDADEVALSRLAARVRARVAAQPSVAQFLARWFRPLAASLAAFSLIAALGATWYYERSQAPVTLEAAMSTDPVEISVDGDVYNLGQ